MQSFNLVAPVVKATTVANALAGLPIEYWGRAGVLTVYGNADAAGLQASLSFNDGQDIRTVIPPTSALSVATTAGKVATNEDFIGQFPIPGNVRLILSLTNTDGSNDHNANFLFVVT
jgi:hypothetical protein